jgi:hypothetical protein
MKSLRDVETTIAVKRVYVSIQTSRIVPTATRIETTADSPPSNFLLDWVSGADINWIEKTHLSMSIATSEYCGHMSGDRMSA